MTMNWVKENWDKLLGAFFLVVVAGLSGFFSAMSSVKDELTEVKERLSAIEERVNHTVSSDDMSSVSVDLVRIKNRMEDILMPKMGLIDEHEKSLHELRIDFARIQGSWSIIQLQANSTLSQ